MNKDMIFAGMGLARRLEAAEGAMARGCIEGHKGTDILEVGGGVAVFAGPESPLTQAVGVGMNGPVVPAELDCLEDFFRSRRAAPKIELCPLADAGLIEMLAGRGYRPVEFNNALVRLLVDGGPPAIPRVRRAADSEGEVWSRVVGEAFLEQPLLSEEEMEIGRAIFAMPGALCYLAGDGPGEPAGGAALAITGGCALLFADGVIARFRRQGFHKELIAARLKESFERGCEIATASALPGSGSQRNYERMGFQVAYTKVTLSSW